MPRIIEKLKDAGIKTWILTGDKLETALYVGKKCKLSGKADSKEQLVICENEAEFKDIFNTLESEHPDGCELMAIDGSSLGIILKKAENETRFFMYAAKCDALILCRLAPN